MIGHSTTPRNTPAINRYGMRRNILTTCISCNRFYASFLKTIRWLRPACSDTTPSEGYYSLQYVNACLFLGLLQRQEVRGQNPRSTGWLYWIPETVRTNWIQIFLIGIQERVKGLL